MARCAGLADDIRYYGRKMREMAWERVGHLYPKAKLPKGGEATVIAWLWARTVPCPNPACGTAMPLMRTFQLSTKANNPHWTKPVPDRAARAVSFKVQNHSSEVPRDGTVNRNGATCVACNGTVPLEYVREQARAGKMSEQMIGIVAEGERKRLFLSPTDEHIRIPANAKPPWLPSGDLPNKALGFRVQAYGFTHWHQLFTERQLVALTTFSDLLTETRNYVLADGADVEYADAVCAYLSLSVGRQADMCSNFNR